MFLSTLLSNEMYSKLDILTSQNDDDVTRTDSQRDISLYNSVTKAKLQTFRSFFPSSPFLVTGQKYEDTKIILIYYKACCLTKQHSRCVK